MTSPILVDANIWIDHFRLPDAHLAALALDRRIRMHPYIIGELALGSLPRRDFALAKLKALPAAPVAKDSHVLMFIEANQLAASGIGYVDCHLLAAAKLASGSVWTRDRRLAAQAHRLGILYAELERH